MPTTEEQPQESAAEQAKRDYAADRADALKQVAQAATLIHLVPPNTAAAMILASAQVSATLALAAATRYAAEPYPLDFEADDFVDAPRPEADAPAVIGPELAAHNERIRRRAERDATRHAAYLDGGDEVGGPWDDGGYPQARFGDSL
jgi:hypothetical protein